MRIIRVVPIALLVALVPFVVPSALLAAEETFFQVPLPQLKIEQGQLPEENADTRRERADRLSWPRVAIDDAGVEAYVGPQGELSFFGPLNEMLVSVRAPAGKDVAGRLILPSAKRGGEATVVRFTIPTSAALKEDAKRRFYEAKQQHYQRLIRHRLPGSAWFRHQITQATRASGAARDADPDIAGFESLGFDDTYGLFTGGRAVSENLQLDRALPPATQQAGAPVKLDSIEGITVAELDWKPHVAGATPALDPLASSIPADQHAAFFPSVAAAYQLAQLAQQNPTPVLQSLEARPESAMLLRKYEKQMCYTLRDLLVTADAGLIDGIALTGSDPYLRDGTDVGLLMETRQPEKLATRLADNIKATAASSAGVTALSGEVDGVAYVRAVAPDRSVSSYIASRGNVVILTNSEAQLRKLAGAMNRTVPSLSAAPEYTFFRQRYPRDARQESALIVLSDATIRRWCGPRWRIADSRRTRAAAALAELQASNAARVVKGDISDEPMTAGFPLVNGGEFTLAAAGVRSSTYGSLAFLTPIAEMELAEVTPAEAEAYGRWRDGYQRNWSWAFDPIALRLLAEKQRVRADLTVMPLIDASDYKELIAASRGASIKPGTGDPHPEALLHVAYAVNADSEPMKKWAAGISQFTPSLKVDPFDWVGQTVAVYADEDPFWSDLAAERSGDFFPENLGRLPVALYAQVRQPLKLAAFLAGARAFVEQSAPGLTQWATPTHRDHPYVKISATNEGRAQVGGDKVGELAIYYTVSPDSIVLTLNEQVLKRSIDRQLARRAAASQPAGEDGAATQAATAAATRPWLGSNLALQLDGKMLEIAHSTRETDAHAAAQALAWKNLPILNEWKRLFPERDPVAVHQQLWHARPIDPAGGNYVWNEQWRTMESTTYGHPAAPKAGPATPDWLRLFRHGNFGVDFEENGIRAKADVTLGRE